MKTTLYRPDTMEETKGLIAETVRDLLENLRLSEWLEDHYEVPPFEKREEESTAAFMRRVLRHLLPTNDAADVLWVRTQFGWTRGEIQHITTILNQAFIYLNREANERVTAAFTSPLRQDAEKLERLRNRWEELVL